MSKATDRLLSKRFGVFNHYLFGMQNGSGKERNPKGIITSWNECVDEFDTDKLAYQLHQMGAGYYCITLMQGTKYMIAPNETFDRIGGTNPGEACSLRDLPEDLYRSLSKYDIDLYLYYTGDGPYLTKGVGDRFGMPDPRIKVTDQFVSNWAAVLEEYAVRYGDKVKGWWVDGCYEFLGYNNENLSVYYKAAKVGNPDSLVAFNNGINPTLQIDYSVEDITCGEFNDFIYIPESRYIDGVQTHMLIPLGVFPDNTYGGGAWGFPGCKRDKEYMLDFIRKSNAVGTPVTVDIFVRRDGSFDPEQMELLSYVGKNL